MSRAGYSEIDGEYWSWIRYRGAVTQAIRGRRGQALLVKLYEALERMPEKQLIAHELVADGGVCALGAVAVDQGIDVTDINVHDYDRVAELFEIAPSLAREIVFINDEDSPIDPSERYGRMRRWVVRQLRDPS